VLAGEDTLLLRVVVVAALLKLVVDDALPVLVVAEGSCCTITSTYVGPPAAWVPAAVVPTLLVVDDAVPVLVPVPVALFPSAPALPSSTNKTVAPEVSMPMKFPTRGAGIPVVAVPLVVVALLVCEVLANGLTLAESKAPVQPCPPRVLLKNDTNCSGAHVERYT
jgi:hypothetical protein